MSASPMDKTIAQVCAEFLADQQARISRKTFQKYETIIGLYQSYLESYWPGHDGEASKIMKVGGTYCGTFGPEDITEGYSEFLGYFMPRKVMCGQDTMQAAGTVTKKLAKWLVEKGYLKATEDTEYAHERAASASRDLPRARKVQRLLDAYLDETAPAAYADKIEDHFIIERLAPGKLWLEPLTASTRILGPIPVPPEVTDLCQPMWDLGGVVVKVGKEWQLLEVWSVTP